MLSKHEVRLLSEAFKCLLSKVGGATENPVRKILKKQASKPRPKSTFPKYSEFQKTLRLESSSNPITDYGRYRSPVGG